jgi:hypothetical protein
MINDLNNVVYFGIKTTFSCIKINEENDILPVESQNLEILNYVVKCIHVYIPQ